MSNIIKKLSLLIILFSSLFITGSLSMMNTGYGINENSIAVDDFQTDAVVYDWLVINYLDGDNNLEENAIDDINEMESTIGLSGSICSIVLLDRTTGYDTSNGDWTGTRMYNITSDATSLINSELLEDWGEMNMGDGATLLSFMDYCLDNYTANRYWLNIWDHGGGIDGICWDDSSSGDALTIDEMQSAIDTVTSDHSMTFDVISHDACYMNMIEVGYELKDYADYFVASEEAIPLDGFDYYNIFNQLQADPTMDGSTLCELIVDTYETYYTSISDTALSALNLTMIDSVVTATNYLSTNLSAVISAGDGSAINEAFQNTQSFYSSYIVDFKHFVEQLLANVTLMSTYTNLQSAATTLNNLLATFVIDNYQHTSYSGNAEGVTIFMPTVTGIYQTYIDDYIDALNEFSDLDWITDTQWDEFLDDFYGAGFGLPDLGYEELSLDVSTGTTGLSADEDHYYQIILPELSVYEFTLEVLSGDADLYLYDGSDLSQVGFSALYNPADGDTETIRINLEAGIYIVNVYGFESSSYNLEASNVGPITINLNDVVTGSSGSIDGDNDHFWQTCFFYYEITLDEAGSYDFTLTYSSSSVDFDLAILTEYYVIVEESQTTGNEDHIELTISSATTYIVLVYAYTGHGSFSFTVTGETTPGLTGLFPGFTILTSIIGLVAIGTLVAIFMRKK
ncbi:MAG: hypothetical protein FK733_19045 [Asgard group archaeon]|nr:hypothetical protein [Asgard group archaeon]